MDPAPDTQTRQQSTIILVDGGAVEVGPGAYLRMLSSSIRAL